MRGWLGGFRCGRCSEQRAARQRALRSPRRPALAICEACLAGWQRMGHRCSRCWTTVRDRLDVGVLVETGAFAHVGCGGARVLGKPVTGPIDPPAHSA
jgi:hypothetical protein